MILIIDNYDSFTYNLAQQFSKVSVTVLRNDDPAIEDAAKYAEALVLSPGPGRPEEAGMLLPLINQYKESKPILGICLGHQAIGQVFGATVRSAPHITHGKQSQINYKPAGILADFKGKMRVMRYHSLMIEKTTIPKEFDILAETAGCVMAIQHRTLPIVGLQFHPESIGTKQGQYFIDQFLALVQKTKEGTAHAANI